MVVSKGIGVSQQGKTDRYRYLEYRKWSSMRTRTGIGMLLPPATDIALESQHV
jgi:hypothetical protein